MTQSEPTILARLDGRLVMARDEFREGDIIVQMSNRTIWQLRAPTPDDDESEDCAFIGTCMHAGDSNLFFVNDSTSNFRAKASDHRSVVKGSKIIILEDVIDVDHAIAAIVMGAYDDAT